MNDRRAYYKAYYAANRERIRNRQNSRNHLLHSVMGLPWPKQRRLTKEQLLARKVSRILDVPRAQARALLEESP